MAKAPDLGFTGRVGNLIFYKVNGNKYVRTMPSKVRQTKATKAKASEFGKASTLGSLIRSQMLPIVANPKDLKMQTRLVSAVYQWLLQLKDRKNSNDVQPDGLTGFQFNEQPYFLKERLRVGFTVGLPSKVGLQIKIPAFIPREAIAAPAHTEYVICRIVSCVIDVDKKTSLGNASAELVIPYHSQTVASQTIYFKLRVPKGSLIITGVSLEYQVTQKGRIVTTTNRNFMPSEIVDTKWI